MARSPMLLVRLSAVLVGALAVHASALAESLKVMSGSYGPANEVRVAQPTMRWEIWPAEGSAKVTDVDFRIDEKRVDARYDQPSRSVVHQPAKPLPVGSHKVEVVVTFEGKFKFRKNWTTIIASTAASALPTPSATQVEALRAANALRSKLRLPAMTMDPRMSTASQLHAEYLTRNAMTGHYQRPGTPGFFGQTAADRLAQFGWAGGSWEGVTYGSSSVTEGVHDLYDAPYHRLPFLQPGSIEFGAGFEGARLAATFGVSRERGTVVSPADGQHGVPVSWTNTEKPNPLRMHTTEKVVGYPIMLAHFEPGVETIRVTSAKLSLFSGQEVPTYLNTPENDSELKYAAILFPRKPLKPSTTYRVTFQGVTDRGAPIQVSATFTTATR